MALAVRGEVALSAARGVAYTAGSGHRGERVLRGGGGDERHMAARAF